MTVVLRITKPTYNALTETNPRNFIFSSDFNHLKTAASGTISKTLAGNTSTSQTVAHGLSVLPLVLGYFRQSGEDEWYITMSAAAAVILTRPLIDLNVAAAVDSTYVTFFFINDNAAQRTIELRYEILYEGS